MSSIIIRRLPAGGITRVSVAAGTTLSNVVESENLSGLTITVNGESIPANRFATFSLNGGERINASRSVKGA